MAELGGAMLSFCELLRTEFRFDAGHDQAHQALTAVERIGVDDRERVRYALRMVYCSKEDQLDRFDRAFDAFFSGDDPGVAQPRPPQPTADGEDDSVPPSSRRETRHEPAAEQASKAIAARYSPSASQSEGAPSIPDARMAEALADAGRLIAALHLGRSRKWKPRARGERLDMRRTLRSSLQTGGDPAHLRLLGHPLRNPRIVLLIDASRSMSEHAPDVLQFGYALCRRSRRTSVFVFSTELHEITRTLRGLHHANARRFVLPGEAWGGGTRIGSALREFVKRYSARVDRDTLVIVASDGLDMGEVSELRAAMRWLHRRSAGVMWLNPHAGKTGFIPVARAMRAALPYVSMLLDAKNLQSLGAAVRHLRR